MQENTLGPGLFIERSAPDESNSSLLQRCTTVTSTVGVDSQKLNVTSVSEESQDCLLTEKLEWFWKLTQMPSSVQYANILWDSVR